MITFALDTSTEVGSFVLMRDDAVWAQRSLHARMEHSAQLFPSLDQLLAVAGLKLSDVNLFAVGIGPGSFSGIRVSIAALKGLRLATNIPIVGVRSVDALAAAARSRMPAGCSEIAVLLDARREEFFVARYRVANDGVTGIAARLLALAALPEFLAAPTLMVGPDHLRFKTRLESLHWKTGIAPVFENVPAFPEAAVIGKLGRAKFLQQGGDKDVEPIYLRHAVHTLHSPARPLHRLLTTARRHSF